MTVSLSRTPHALARRGSAMAALVAAAFEPTAAATCAVLVLATLGIVGWVVRSNKRTANLVRIIAAFVANGSIVQMIDKESNAQDY